MFGDNAGRSFPAGDDELLELSWLNRIGLPAPCYDEDEDGEVVSFHTSKLRPVFIAGGRVDDRAVLYRARMEEINLKRENLARKIREDCGRYGVKV